MMRVEDGSVQNSKKSPMSRTDWVNIRVILVTGAAGHITPETLFQREKRSALVTREICCSSR